jgi:ribonuclease HII
MGPLNFIIALAIATASLVSGSLVWPRLTTQQRPRLLQEVHDVALKTSIGKETANVLGVSDETNIQPMNIGQMTYSLVNSAKDAVQKRVQTVIVGNAVNQLSSQFDRLPKEQKEQIQQILCKPITNQASSTASATQ